jgi:predicted metalloprotease with PDZ domain
MLGWRRKLRCGGGGATVIGLVLGYALLAGAPVRADTSDTVHYVLTPLPEVGRLRVEMTWFTRGRTASAALVSPRWGTVDDVPALLRGLQFGGGVRRVERQQARWILHHPRDATITCSYEVDPGGRRLDWTGPHYPVTTPTFFHGMGNAFLLTPQGGGGLPELYDVTLRWKLPAGWRAACSWGSGPHIGAQISPDDVRHSTYLAGEIEVRTVERDGLKISVALRDRFRFNADEFAELAATIVAQQCRFMDERDFPPFLVAAVPGGEPIGRDESHLVGMGLYQSFVLFAAPASALTDGFESLFSHELFHHWNGRVLKAQQPDKLVYWFVEGFTEYYALRILYESGHWSAETYAKWINRHLRDYHNNPARNATNQDILERYWQERNTVGEVAYQRGVLLGLRWHRMARERSGPDGLDRLFKTLVERGRPGGFEVSNEEIRRVGVQTLGRWFGEEFDRFVTEARTVDVPLDALEPQLIGAYEQVHTYELGFDARQAAAEKRAIGVLRGSAAERAGLREGDELAAARVHSDPDQLIEVRVRRAGQLETIRYYPRGRQTYALQFRPAPDGASPGG